MTTQTTRRPTHRAAWRPAVLGFTAGFAMAFVVAVLALLLTAFERLEDVLVPGAWLLSPLRDAMAGWNGLVNMLLAGTVNGLVYAAVFALAAAATRAVRRPRP